MSGLLRIGLRGKVLPQLAVALARKHKVTILAPAEKDLATIHETIVNAAEPHNPYNILPNISYFTDTRRLDNCEAVIEGSKLVRHNLNE